MTRFGFKSRKKHGQPKFRPGDIVRNFTVKRYAGHSYINKRTHKEMSKAQHWYRCECTCGAYEYRSQQELIDKNGVNDCSNCRNST